MYYITLIKVVEGLLRKVLHSKHNIQQPFVNFLYNYSSSLTVTTCLTFKPSSYLVVNQWFNQKVKQSNNETL